MHASASFLSTRPELSCGNRRQKDAVFLPECKARGLGGGCSRSVIVTVGFGFWVVASNLCFRDKPLLKLRFWWRVCSESAEIVPNVWCGANFADDMKVSRRHFLSRRRTLCVEVEFSRQAQGTVRLRRWATVNVVVTLGRVCGWLWF